MTGTTTTRALGATLLLALFTGAPTLSAQADPAAHSRDTAEVRIHSLEHSDASAARKTLHSLLGGLVRNDASASFECVADDRTNTLVVRAEPRMHAEIESILQLIDVRVTEQEPSAERTVTRSIPLRHRSTTEMFPIAELHDVLVQVISSTNTLVVRGFSADVEEVAQLITSLDTPAPSFELEFWVLEHGAATAIAAHPVLAPLERELAKSDLGGYGVLTSTSVRGLAGSKLQSRQNFDGGRIDQLMLRGTIHPTGDGAARVDLSADFQIENEPSDRGAGDGGATGVATVQGSRTGGKHRTEQASFSVTTELQTRIGNLVVLGLAPTGDASSKPLVLVLRVK